MLVTIEMEMHSLLTQLLKRTFELGQDLIAFSSGS